MKFYWRGPAALLLLCAWGIRAWAGGSGLNVVVVVNQNSTNSVQLGNYYCEKRQVPPQNLLRTTWTGGNISWTKPDFTSVILNPLLAMLSARQLTNQVDYVLLSMDFPYRITDSTGANSTTTPLFYGFVPDDPAPSPGLPASCSLPNASSNSYAGSEAVFRSVAPGTSRTNFLTFMLTCSNLAQAKQVIDRGVASDSTFFTQTVYLGKSTDVFRNIRYLLFDNAIFNTRLRGDYSMQRTNVNTANFLGYIGGYENGVQLATPTTNYAPGALADQLTSFGGQLYEQSAHTTALQFNTAGAAGSYGTVVEPCAYLEKFPSPQNYFYQARGFTAAECYYQSVTNPYQGVFLGEPLAAPFALPPTGAWSSLPENALLAGTTNLSLEFLAPDTNHPVQQVDLFVDGIFAQTLTNIPPRQYNVLSAVVRGRTMTYTVPANATLQSVAAGLTAVLNNSGNTNVTKVRAFNHGDRIELQSFDISQSGAQVPVVVSSSAGSASALTTFLAAAAPTCLDTIAYGLRSYSVQNAPSLNDYVLLTITKTNGAVVKVAFTNTVSGTTVSSMVQALVTLVNATSDLQGSDGVIAEDYIGYDPGTPYAEFNLRARSIGWQAAQIQVALTASSHLSPQPSGTRRVDGNLSDLEPRDHLYLTAGTTNLALTFPFNTTTQADGYHELTAVAYEGSHVRTQKRVAQTVRIQNTPLSATFTTLYGGSNTAVSATLQFAVVADTSDISKIELFSTGGSLDSVLNQSNATFSVAGVTLQPGLHPFYALVTAGSGKQYRTETAWIRLVGTEPPFTVSLTTPPPVLTWPATIGRTYDILTATDITNAFQPTASLTPSNSAAEWTDTNPAAPARFYRVRASN